MREPTLLLQMTSEIAADLTRVPDTSGVYALFWIQPDATPLGTDCGQAGDIEAIELMPLYIGASKDSLRVRIKRHIMGDTRGSTLRASLGMILAERLDLQIVQIPTKRYFCIEPEQRLSDWIVLNTIVGYFETNDPFELEKAMLAVSAGKLNISGCQPNEISGHLKLLRANASGQHVSGER